MNATDASRGVVGIDFTTSSVKVHILPDGEDFQFLNNPNGFREIKDWLKQRLPSVILVMCRGVLSSHLVAQLVEARLPMAVVHPGEMKIFARQNSPQLKLTIPCPGLVARYGVTANIQPRQATDDQLLTLEELITRQGQLMNIRSVEMNRRCRARSFFIQISHELLLDTVNAQLKDLEEQVCHLLKSSPIWRSREKA